MLSICAHFEGSGHRRGKEPVHLDKGARSRRNKLSVSKGELRLHLQRRTPSPVRSAGLWIHLPGEATDALQMEIFKPEFSQEPARQTQPWGTNQVRPPMTTELSVTTTPSCILT